MLEFVEPLATAAKVDRKEFTLQRPAANVGRPPEDKLGGIKQSSYVVHDADLLVPPTRDDVSAFGNVSPEIVRGGAYTNQQDLATALAKLLKQDVPKHEKKSTGELGINANFADLQDMVKRLTAMLSYYQSKYPVTSLSVLGHELEVQVRQNETPQVRYAFLHPLVKAYDEKLFQAESHIKTMQLSVNELNDRVRDLTRGNQESFKNLQGNFESKSSQQTQQIKQLEAQLESLKLENSSLLASQQKNDELLKKAFGIQKTVPLLQNHVASLRSLSTTQADTITTLSTSVTTLETKLEDSLNRIEHLTQRNKNLVEQCLNYEQKCRAKIEELDSLSSAHAKLAKWKQQHAGIVEDWQDAIQALGLTQLLGDNVLTAESLHFKGVLCSHVKRQLSEIKSLQAQFHELKESERKLEQENAAIAQNFVLQLEKKNVEVQFSKDQYDSISKTLDSLRHERDNAIQESQRAAREAAQLDLKLKDVIHQRDRDIADIIENSNSKLRRLREDHDDDRIRYQSQIEQLQKSKVELQCEVGHLLRDKRTIEFELEQSVRNKDIERSLFGKNLSDKVKD